MEPGAPRSDSVGAFKQTQDGKSTKSSGHQKFVEKIRGLSLKLERALRKKSRAFVVDNASNKHIMNSKEAYFFYVSHTQTTIHFVHFGQNKIIWGLS